MTTNENAPHSSPGDLPKGDLRPRKVWVAKTLTHLAPGLGHLYCGQVNRGLAILFAECLLFPLVLTFLMFGSSSLASWLLLIALGVGIAVAIYATHDAKRVAKSSTDYRLKPVNRWWIYVLIALQPISFIIPISLLVKQHLIEAFHIAGDSMAPNLRRADLVLVDKRNAGEVVPHRGEVIVFRCPGDRGKHYVKRIVGLPGEHIQVDEQGRVLVDGQEIAYRELRPSEQPVGHKSLDATLHAETTDDSNFAVLLADGTEGKSALDAVIAKNGLVVPKEHVFVLGDNRGKSLDSRSYGTVPIGDVLGPVAFIVRPANTWRRFGRFRP